MKKYSIIYADPPWAYRTYSKKGQGQSAESHYPTMCIRKTAAEMIEGIDAKMRLLSQERNIEPHVVLDIGDKGYIKVNTVKDGFAYQLFDSSLIMKDHGFVPDPDSSASSVAESLCVELGVFESDIHIIPHQAFVLMLNEKNSNLPIYRETANYAYESGELESYRASLAANVECRRAIEAAISSNYGDNRLDADAAVKSVLEQFSPERVRYVLANTIQKKDFDGRIPQPLKEWAKSVEVCPENASRFLVDKPNPGLTALFVDAFRQQTEPQKEATSEKTEERDPEVVAWENDEIASIEVKTVEVKSPFAPLPEEAAKAPKAHRLTAEEKEIKAAVMDTLKGQIAYNNDGMRASYRASNHSFNLLARNGVRIEGNTVTQNGEPLFKIHRRHAARKTQGCYRELLPTLEYVKQEQKQEKPSIRDQLKAAAKQQPEKKSPIKSITHDMEL